MRLVLIGSLLLVGCSSAPPQVGCEDCVVLSGAQVFDGTRAGPGTVVLRGTTVESVNFGDVRATGHVIALDGKTVMPGLFDLHVHAPAPSGPYGFQPQEDAVPAHLKAMLRSGVTSFLDLGSSARLIFEYRERLRDGRLLGPNLFAAGPLLTPMGGHPCYEGGPAGDSCAFIDAPADVGQAFATLMPQHPDVIKLVIESGSANWSLPRMTTASMAGIAVAAAQAGVTPIAHVSKLADVADALDAGIRRFAHVPYDQPIDDALAHRMAELGVVVVPTLAVQDGMQRLAAGTLDELIDPTLPDDVGDDVIAALADRTQLGRFTDSDFLTEITRDRDIAVENVRRLHAAGVTIACGTDAGNPATFAGRAVVRELALYVEAGLTPIEALQAATRNAAQLLGRSDLGVLTPGALADLLVVDGDATADITAVGRPQLVFHHGQQMDRDALALPRGTSLTTLATSGRTSGQTCLVTSDCADGLACGYDNTCASACTSDVNCAAGAVCAPSATDSFCLAGDGCDPVAQGCPNGTACVWWGHGATECWFAGTAQAGQRCSATGTCAIGLRCDYASSKCIRMCDPAQPFCPGSQTCIDRSALAGIRIGDCQ